MQDNPRGRCAGTPSEDAKQPEGLDRMHLNDNPSIPPNKNGRSARTGITTKYKTPGRMYVYMCVGVYVCRCVGVYVSCTACSLLVLPVGLVGAGDCVGWCGEATWVRHAPGSPLHVFLATSALIDGCACCNAPSLMASGSSCCC